MGIVGRFQGGRRVKLLWASALLVGFPHLAHAQRDSTHRGYRHTPEKNKAPSQHPRMLSQGLGGSEEPCQLGLSFCCKIAVMPFWSVATQRPGGTLTSQRVFG